MWMNSSRGVGGLIEGATQRFTPAAAAGGKITTPHGAKPCTCAGGRCTGACQRVVSLPVDAASGGSEEGMAFTVTGFLMGVRADTMLATHSHAAIIARLLSQIDAMFGMDATGAYVAGFVHSWADEPFIRGAYSTPTHEEDAQGARRLAEPHCSVVFFAGEATAGTVEGTLRDQPANRTHYASPIVLHGAMNTGAGAACDVARSLGYAVVCTSESHSHSQGHGHGSASAKPTVATAAVDGPTGGIVALKSPASGAVTCTAIRKRGGATPGGGFASPGGGSATPSAPLLARL
jgi:hypothetical protein